MTKAYKQAVLGQIEWYKIRIKDLQKQTEHLERNKRELEGRIS